MWVNRVLSGETVDECIFLNLSATFGWIDADASYLIKFTCIEWYEKAIRMDIEEF